MNRNLWLLMLCQGFFLTNNVAFIAINGLVGFSLAPKGWLATLPVMGYVLGGALSAHSVALLQQKWGRKRSFQIGLIVAMFSAFVCAYAVFRGYFWLLSLATLIAGFYNANASLYRFAAAEITQPQSKETAISMVMAGGLIGAIAGPNVSSYFKNALSIPFLGVYLALVVVAAVAFICISLIDFSPLSNDQHAPKALNPTHTQAGTPLVSRSRWALVKQPIFIVAALCSAFSYGVMNLLMASTPLAMQTCGFSFNDAAWVLEWHVIGMFAPGFITGHLIKRLGTGLVMSVGLFLLIICIIIALSGIELHHFLWASFFLGIGWNFVFTTSTTLTLKSYEPHERDSAQAMLNFAVFVTLSISSLFSGALVTTQGWNLVNYVSLPLVFCMILALIGLWIKDPKILKA